MAIKLINSKAKPSFTDQLKRSLRVIQEWDM